VERSQEPRSCQARPVVRSRLQEACSCQARALGYNSLQEARSCHALAEGCQGRPTRLQGQRRRWRHRSRLVMLGVDRSTIVTR
jgi:hypothetical protein